MLIRPVNNIPARLRVALSLLCDPLCDNILRACSGKGQFNKEC